MKGEGSIVEMEIFSKHQIPPPASDPEMLPLLSPPLMLRVEHHEGGSESDEGDELEKGSGGAACRICLEAESLTLGDELISPCMCKGTQQFVHRGCLDHWRSVKEGFAFSHCTTCKAQFHLRPELPEDYSWRKIKFKLFVARDMFLVFIAVQLTIGMLGGITYLLDETFNANWDRILPKHQFSVYYCVGMFLFFLILGVGGMIVHCLSMNNGACVDDFRSRCYAWACFPASIEACGVFLVVFIIIFTIMGVAYGLLAATMGVQRIWQRHYHILTKRVLTKEYIVEDMHGQYEPPTLAPEHESRLRSLNLL